MKKRLTSNSLRVLMAEELGVTVIPSQAVKVSIVSIRSTLHINAEGEGDYLYQHLDFESGGGAFFIFINVSSADRYIYPRISYCHTPKNYSIWNRLLKEGMPMTKVSN